MRNENEIKRGLLKNKMAGYAPEPPPSAWSAIEREVSKGDNRKRLFFTILTAAGFALAIGVGLTLLFHQDVEQITDQQNTGFYEQTEKLKHNERNLNEMPSEENKERETAKNISPLSLKKFNLHIAEPSDHHDQYNSKLSFDGNIKNDFEKGIIKKMQEVIAENEKRGILITENTEPVIVSMNIDSLKISANEISKNRLAQEDSLLHILHGEVEIPVVTEERSSVHRWHVGASMSPLYSYRDADAMDSYRNTIANLSETAKITYSGGIKVGFTQSKRLSFESGLYYNRMGVKIGDYSGRNTGFFTGTRNDMEYEGNILVISNSMGTITNEVENVAVSNYGKNELQSVTGGEYYTDNVMIGNSSLNTLSQSLDYLEIPLKLKYLIYDRIFKMQVSGGISTNFLVNSSVIMNTGMEKLDLGEVKELRRINYSGNAGIGFIYEFMQNMSVTLEPNFRYYLNSVNPDYLPSTRPYTFGVYTGLNYTF